MRYKDYKLEDFLMDEFFIQWVKFPDRNNCHFWEKWLQEAGICDSLQDVDFIEIHAFGCAPKSPNPLVDPLGYAAEQDRLRKAYAEAYQGFFRDHLPDNGVPARFTVHLLDVPDKAASYEFYGTALYQKALQEKERA